MRAELGGQELIAVAVNKGAFGRLCCSDQWIGHPDLNRDVRPNYAPNQHGWHFAILLAGTAAIYTHTHNHHSRHRSPQQAAHARICLAQGVGVQKHDGIQCHTLCGRRHLALAGEPAQKLVDLGRPHLQWMTHLVKPQVKAYPVPVTFLGADAVVMRTHQGLKLLPQARLRWLPVHVIPFTGFLYSSNRFTKDSCQANTAESMSDKPAHCFKKGFILRRLRASGVIPNATVMR